MISPHQVKLNVQFLSADELRGRDTGSPEIDIAAAYIAIWFQVHGVQPAYGDSSYSQHVPFEQRSLPDEITFSVGDSSYQNNRDLILMSSYIGELEGEIIYLKHATEEELAEGFGLEAISDPVPEQNLFDHSDNVNFATRGIPSPTYSMGLTAFDEEINYYYHRVTDEAETPDFGYVTSYIRSFMYAAQLIGNEDEAPFWLPGDKYAPAVIELYSKE